MSAQSLFLGLLDQHIQDTKVSFRVNGMQHSVGRNPAASHAEREIVVRVKNPQFFTRVLSAGNLGMGEAFMNDEFEMESGGLQDFLLVLLRNRLDRSIRMSPMAVLQILWFRLAGMLRGKATNVQRHYDVGDDLFQAFLDSNLVYSCGYVTDRDDDLEQLQLNKMDRICRKLRLKPGDKLLDIGCGYGGLLIHAATHYGATGCGVTLSRQHCDQGTARIKQAGLQSYVEILYSDFNDISGDFNKVVSVGMMEHVPRREYNRYFRKIAQVLKKGGLGLVHTLGANAPVNQHDAFFQKYIFPNSNQPRLSEIASGLERQELVILDVENMIRHYGYTVREWRRRFLENRGNLNPESYDGRFMRMWEYYLACGIAAAFASDSALYQVLFTNDYTANLPLHRV